MPDTPRHGIDVDALVKELRARVAERRRLGDYADDASVAPLALPPPEAPVRFRPERGYSSKPIVGRPITAAKQGLLRLLHHVLDDMAQQTSAALDADRRWTEEALAAEAAARTASQRDVLGLLARIEVLERLMGEIRGGLEHLQAGPRLARLERARSAPALTVAPPDAARTPTSAAPSAAAPPLDYLAFEARFRGSEETIRERQTVYRDLLSDRRRVVDLGCGRGELVQLLREAGVDAYGVELNGDFIDLMRERDLPVVCDDALRHLEGLDDGEVDGIVASHVVEHMPPDAVTRLVVAAVDRLAPGGLLVLETPNPESLVAGSVNFHRDPTHLRPVHPDTLAFVCESAGFTDVEVRRLSAVPEHDRLPAVPPGTGELGAHVGDLVERLNALLYGYQDYAVVARRPA